jgi:hypothetical protein
MNKNKYDDIGIAVKVIALAEKLHYSPFQSVIFSSISPLEPYRHIRISLLARLAILLCLIT